MVGNRWALEFDGANRAVSIPDSPSLRPTSLTLAGWFRWRSVPTIGQSLIAKSVGSGMYDSYQLFYDPGDHQLRGVVGGASAFGAYTAFNWTPTAGTWYHIAFTFDHSSKTGLLYLNGVQVAKQALGAGFTIGYDSGSLEIGRDKDSGVWVGFFAGQVDEVGLYYRALGAGEIAALAGAGRPPGLRTDVSTGAPARTTTQTPTSMPTPTGTSTPTRVAAGAATPTPTGTPTRR